MANLTNEELFVIKECVLEKIERLERELTYEEETNVNSWHYTRHFHNKIKLLRELIGKLEKWMT